MNNFIFFYSHKPNSYKINKERCIFSQWYQKSFIGYVDGIYKIHDISDNIKYLIDNKNYNCREQYMMSMKCLLFINKHKNNINIFNDILNCKKQGDIKKLGRQIKGFDNNIWDKWKYKIVVNGNYYQFCYNISDNKMYHILLSTNNKILVEASKYDNIWGIGFSEKDALNNINNWGNNLLGKALMEVRKYLRQTVNN
jgi:hypothetical protein